MNEHLLKRFDEELTKLKFRLVRMGTLVQQQIEMAIRSLVENNKELANVVIINEEKVDKLDLKIDKQCLRIFALHQPVAMDLRLVLSSVSMNDNMELLGDMAASIANSVVSMKMPPGLLENTKFEEMGKLLQQIISNIMDSYINMNADFSHEPYSRINELYKNNFFILNEIINENNYPIEACCYLIDINRCIQLISRQAKSIAEEIVFLIEARIIKHLDLQVDDEE